MPASPLSAALIDRLWDQCTPERMADSAFRPPNKREIFVDQPQWTKDFPGQVTDGRIGRPHIAEGPISWLPKAKRDAVMAILKAKGIS